MNKKSSANTTAVIEIGSNNVRMRVSQLSKGKLSTLDTLEHPVALGHDVFENGSISFNSLRELSGVLSKFSASLLSYNIEKPRVVSCTVLREAKNRSLVADQLKVRNNMDVTVLEDGQEKAYIYSEIIQALTEEPSVRGKNSMIAYVGSGSIGIAVFDGEKIVYSQNISMGASKLNDILHELRRQAEDFYTLLEEYLETLFNRISIEEFQVENLIFTGSQIRQVAKLCGAKQENEVYHISIKNLQSVYNSLRPLTAESVGIRCGITERQAAVLYTALFIYRGMLRFCPNAKEVLSPPADISMAITRRILQPKSEVKWDNYIHDSALACAWDTAKRFGCNPAHSKLIGEYACGIFDKLKKIHGLDPSKRLILQLAAILHSCGSVVSVRQHNRCTFDLVKGMDIFGLSAAEVLETAFVAGSISDNLSVEENPDFSLLSNRERIVISKLAAIFRLANAMDKSHREKLKNLKISLDVDKVYFTAKSSSNTLLERWAFEESSQFFKDVFGLSPELAVKFDRM